MDLTMDNKQSYLVISDYYSRFIDPAYALHQGPGGRETESYLCLLWNSRGQWAKFSSTEVRELAHELDLKHIKVRQSR